MHPAPTFIYESSIDLARGQLVLKATDFSAHTDFIYAYIDARELHMMRRFNTLREQLAGRDYVLAGYVLSNEDVDALARWLNQLLAVGYPVVGGQRWGHKS